MVRITAFILKKYKKEIPLVCHFVISIVMDWELTTVGGLTELNMKHC
jgi:hypothetical protein